jgi:hypothetical protein
MTSFYVTTFICSSVRATLTIFSMTSALVIEKIVKVQILFVCMGQHGSTRCQLYYYNRWLLINCQSKLVDTFTPVNKTCQMKTRHIKFVAYTHVHLANKTV